MATTSNSYTGNGSTTNYSITFPYLDTADIKAQIDGVTTTAFSLANATTVQFNSAPGNGTDIIIYRQTSDDALAGGEFFSGSSIRAQTLNNNFNQTLYIGQETAGRALTTLGGTMIGDLSMATGAKVVFEGATDDAHETTLTVTDPTADRTISLPNVSGTVVTTGDTGTVSNGMLAGNSVDSSKIADGSIVNADINASAAIAGTKISPNFGSQNIVTSGTVDGRDVSTDGAKLDGIEVGATADQTNAEIRAAVEAASDSNVFTDADHTKLNGIEASATADQTAAEIRTLVESATDSNVFTDADHTKLNGIEASATADQTASEIKTLIASSPLDNSHLAANSVTTSEIADAELTTLAGMQSGTASKLADSTALTADLADLNQLDGMGKETTITDDDAKFPTSGAVVDYVAAQIAPLGGLEVIATEVAFPNTQPASGVVISISDAGGVVFNGSGSSTTGRTVGGSTVTINNAPSSLNSETLAAGVGLMVSSTGSSQTYNYHKILGKEDDIKQLSDDINDFNARYRVNAGEPSSNNDEGDLVYDTNANKMKVYDNSTSTWKEVTSTGEFKHLFLCPAGGSGAPTINGSIATYDLREVSNSGSSASVTTAAQLLVSVNGVVQKANTGTSAPSEGFALVDANTIIFGTNLPSGADVFIVQIGSAVSIPTPGDDTCSTAKIQNGAITQAKVSSEAINEAKLQISNAPTNGYVLTAQSGNTGGMTWQLAAAGATGGNSNANGVFWENENTVTHDYTIQNNHNAGSFGPITINNGVTVTVGSGENWTIV